MGQSWWGEECWEEKRNWGRPRGRYHYV